MALACETELEEYVERLAAQYGGGQRALLPVLQDIQEEHNYLPRPLLEQVACTLDLSLAQVYRIATFYKAFSLEPRGKYVIQVCLGTSCHLRGGPQLAETIHHHLGIAPGETTPDGLFTLTTVNCLGACALSPVMLVGKDYHAQVTPERVGRILDAYRKES